MSEPGPSSAVPLYSKIDEFDAAKESIHTYLERVELYFVANAVAEAKQPAVLLTIPESKATETKPLYPVTLDDSPLQVSKYVDVWVVAMHSTVLMTLQSTNNSISCLFQLLS